MATEDLIFLVDDSYLNFRDVSHFKLVYILCIFICIFGSNEPVET